MQLRVGSHANSVVQKPTRTDYEPILVLQANMLLRELPYWCTSRASVCLIVSSGLTALDSVSVNFPRGLHGHRTSVQVAAGPPELEGLTADVTAAAARISDTAKAVEDIDAAQESLAQRFARQSALVEKLQAATENAEESVTALTARIASEAARCLRHADAAVAPCARSTEVQVCLRPSVPQLCPIWNHWGGGCCTASDGRVLVQ